MSTQFFQRQNGTIAYDDQGSGPLILTSPSVGDMRAEYRYITPQLVEAGYRVVNMDLRGHGASSTGWDSYTVESAGADLVAMLHHLNAGPAVLIGTSMSAGASIWAAVEAPDLVAALVLIGPAVRDGMPPWQSKLLFTPLFTGPWGASTWTKYYQSLYPFSPPADFQDYLADLKKNMQESGRLAAMRGLAFNTKDAADTRLERVSQPALIVMGSHDPDFKDPKAEAHLLANRMGAEVYIIRDSGHYPHAEKPEITAEAILSFLEKIKQEVPESEYA